MKNKKCLKVKLLQKVRQYTYIEKTKVYGMELFVVKVKDEHDIYCSEKDIAIIIMRDARLKMAYRIAGKSKEEKVNRLKL